MIIQTAPAGKPRLAIMMHEHTALSGQFARAFGNDLFEAAQPDDLLFYVVSHHDEGWAEFDRDPVTDEKPACPTIWSRRRRSTSRSRAGDRPTSTSGGILTAACCRACTVGASTMGATDFQTLC